MTKTIDNEMKILLSASEAAMLLGVSRATFKDMVHQYDLPRLRVNKAIKYPKKLYWSALITSLLIFKSIYR